MKNTIAGFIAAALLMGGAAEAQTVSQEQYDAQVCNVDPVCQKAKADAAKAEAAQKTQAQHAAEVKARRDAADLASPEFKAWRDARDLAQFQAEREAKLRANETAAQTAQRHTRENL